MPRDSQGNYSLPNGTLVSSGQLIQPGQHNPFASDVAAAISQSLSRSGQGSMQSPLDMGGYDIINAGSIGSSKPFDAYTPNDGTTGGLRLHANGTSNMAYLQVVDAAGTGQYGYWQFNNVGVANWSGSALQVNGSAVWHAGNLNPANYQPAGNYVTPNSSPTFTGNVQAVTPNDGTRGGFVVRGDPGPAADARVQFVNNANNAQYGYMQVGPDGRLKLFFGGGLSLNNSPLAFGPTRPSFVVTDGTGGPSGGADGDMYFQYS